jgi:COP9 signalosome complex subunit 6
MCVSTCRPSLSGHDSFCMTDKQVFPSLEFIGWYSVAPHPTARHIALHEQVQGFLTLGIIDLCSMMSQFTGYCSTPLLLLLQPFPSQRSTPGTNVPALPFKAYEPTVEIKDRKSRSVFIEASFNVETGEAERIAVDWTARGGGGGTSCTLRSPFWGYP